MIKINTNFPEAIGSPDHYAPIGATQDNHSNPVYLSELVRIAGNNKFSYLDLACAGGQSVVDIYELGNIACGVEGSDLQKMINSNKWGATYLGGSVIKSGAEKTHRPGTLAIQRLAIQTWDLCLNMDNLLKRRL